MNDHVLLMFVSFHVGQGFHSALLGFAMAPSMPIERSGTTAPQANGGNPLLLGNILAATL
ncbi:hypothetical protein [Devosia sp. Root635]|uniref:hypothetical protein n=1 Tax=Devosia sp. Root635 TaxID=1736575 RepID=UPI001AEC6555|nr:hypothetical protein [Devosia sp. Root635]